MPATARSGWKLSVTRRFGSIGPPAELAATCARACCWADDPSAKPQPAVSLLDEHVADSGEGGLVGDHAGEGGLLFAVVHRVGEGPGD